MSQGSGEESCPYKVRSADQTLYRLIRDVSSAMRWDRSDHTPDLVVQIWAATHCKAIYQIIVTTHPGLGHSGGNPLRESVKWSVCVRNTAPRLDLHPHHKLNFNLWIMANPRTILQVVMRVTNAVFSKQHKKGENWVKRSVMTETCLNFFYYIAFS